MEFDRLVETQIKDKTLLGMIAGLVNRKKNGEELDKEPKITIINDYLVERIAFFENYVKESGSISAPDTGKLDQLFRNTLNEVWV